MSSARDFGTLCAQFGNIDSQFEDRPNCPASLDWWAGSIAHSKKVATIQISCLFRFTFLQKDARRYSFSTEMLASAAKSANEEQSAANANSSRQRTFWRHFVCV
jgi:hypothetical protein